MKAAFSWSVVLWTVGVCAQQGTRGAQFRPTVPDVVGCPVDFAARVDSRLVARSVEDQHTNPESPLVRLSFGPARNILSASVMIHGASRNGLLLPVAQGTLEDLREQFKLSPRPGSRFIAENEVRVSRIALVRWAEIRELRFADGSTWHPTADERCQAVPSLYRQINLTAQ